MKTLTLFALLSAALVSSQAMATSSETLVLSGTVAVVNDISINPVAGAYDGLNITAGQSNLTVANVDETSNNLAGYKITLASANAGELRNTANAAKKTTYTVSYGGGTAAAPSSSAQIVKNVSSLNALTTTSSALNVNVTAYPSAPAGTYNDTLTLAIVAN
jgi:hypothetical protein